MSSVPIFPKPLPGQHQSLSNPLPKLLQTPYGLALLELQGTINLPTRDINEPFTGQPPSGETRIGHLIFPDYRLEIEQPSSSAWMKRVYLYVGKHQRLTGEVKRLPKAIAVIRKRVNGVVAIETDGQAEELEIVEIVKWKILFSQRPEPVGTSNGEA